MANSASPATRKCSNGSRNQRLARDGHEAVKSDVCEAIPGLQIWNYPGLLRLHFFELVVGVAELIAPRRDELVADQIDRHLERRPADRSGDTAVTDFVLCRRSDLARVHHVADVAGWGLFAVDAGNEAAAGHAVEHFKDLAGDGVADPQGFSNDQLAQLRVVKRGRPSLLEVGNGHATRGVGTGVVRWRVPDRRRPDALLHRCRHIVRGQNPDLLGIIGRPARGRYLQNPGIVERMQAWIEFRVGPYRFQLDRPNGVLVRRVLDVDRISDRRQLDVASADQLVPDRSAALEDAIAGPCHVVDFLEYLAVLGPALDDLDTIKIAFLRVFHRPGYERRRLAFQGAHIAAHRHAVGISRLHPVLLLEHVTAVFPAGEQPHLDADAARREGFLPLHGGEDRFTRVLFRPHAAETGRTERIHTQADFFLAAEANLRRSVQETMPAEVVRLRIADGGVMGVARADDSEPVRVATPGVLHRETVLEGFSDVAAAELRCALGAAKQIIQDFEIGEFVVGRQCRMGL